MKSNYIYCFSASPLLLVDHHNVNEVVHSSPFVLQVDQIFRHEQHQGRPKDLEYTIHLVVRTIRFVDNPYTSSSNIVQDNATASLQRIQQYGQSTWEDHLQDHSIYLTRRSFGPAGYAPVGGMCDMKSSHTLCKEDGFNSAFVIAHETGHVLGMEHDGAGNTCHEAPQMGSVMAPLVESNFKRYFWSRCSKVYLVKHIDGFDCLNNNPWLNQGPSSKPYHIPERKYTLDEQCKFDFGEGYSVCKNVRHVSVVLIMVT